MDWGLIWTAVGAIAAVVTLVWAVFVEWPRLKRRMGWARAEETEFKLSEAQKQQNRQAMLALVEHTWIKGVLEKSLYGAAMMALGLVEQAEAVQRPWESVLWPPKREEKLLPAGTKLIDKFDEVGQGLLILGEPGSGKTTVLLDLTRDLIERARRDSSRPIPVVFNLSSWTAEKQSIDEWLVEELRNKYNINRQLGQAWVEQDALALMLDGLDEVTAEQREACVAVLNEFRVAHSFVPLVVCSRIKDYKGLGTKLKLSGVVAIQSLGRRQIETYLEGAGVELTAVRQSLAHDEELRELAETPLMLSIMTLAYRGKPTGELGSLGSVKARRGHIFDHYIETVLARRESDGRFSVEQTKRWLGWLARQMVRYDQSVFLLENMQPGWLERDVERRLYRLYTKLIVGLFGGLIFGLLVMLIGGLTFGLVFGLSGGLIFGLNSGRREQIESIDVLRWSWQSAERTLIDGLIVGLCFGLSFGLLIGLSFKLVVMLIVGLVFGLSVGVIGGLFGGLNRGLSKEFITKTVVETRVKPNEGIWQSLKNGLIVGLIFGLVFGLAVGLIGGLIGGLSVGLNVGLNGWLIGVLIFVLIFGFDTGVNAFIQHFMLRFMLWWQRHLPAPWKTVDFLDYAAERILLRKVGGGYIFVHRLLMEHFAAMEGE